MSYHVFFDFSTGLKKSLRVPKGTLNRILRHVADESANSIRMARNFSG